MKDYDECEYVSDEKKPTFRVHSSQNKDLRAFNIQAESEADARGWVAAITTAIKVCYLSTSQTPHFCSPSTLKVARIALSTFANPKTPTYSSSTIPCLAPNKSFSYFIAMSTYIHRHLWCSSTRLSTVAQTFLPPSTHKHTRATFTLTFGIFVSIPSLFIPRQRVDRIWPLVSSDHMPFQDQEFRFFVRNADCRFVLSLQLSLNPPSGFPSSLS